MPTLNELLSFPQPPVTQAIFLAYQHGQIIAANQKACELFGYAEAAFLQMSSRDLTAFSPDLEAFLERVRTEAVAYGQILLKDANGKVFPSFAETHLIEKTSGSATYLVKITPLHSLPPDLLQQQQPELLTTLGNWELDFVSGLIQVDHHLEQLIGMNLKGGITFKHAEQFLADITLIRRIEKLAMDSALYGMSWAQEFQFITRKTPLWVRGTCAPVFRNGVCVGLKGTVQNIDIFRSISKIYAEQNHQIDFLLEHVNQLVIVRDNQYKLIYCNENATDLFGYSRDEFAVLQINELVYWEDQENTTMILNTAKKEGRIQGFQNRVITKTGELKTISWDYKWFSDSEKLYAIGKDITHQQQFKRKYEGQILQAGEEEKKELFTELHENICQTFAAAKIYISTYENNGDKESLIKAKHMITTGLEAARSLAAVHLFPDLRLQRFVDALQLYFMELNKLGETKFKVDTTIHKSRDLPYSVKTMLYRIIQVLTTRVIKQGYTKNVTLRLTLKSRYLILELIYQTGVEVDACFGERKILDRLQSRLDQLGGSMTIKSDPAKSCNLIIELDLMKYEGFTNVMGQSFVDF